MKRRSRRTKSGRRRVPKTDRKMFDFRLRVESLEPRLVLSQLTGLDLSVPLPADGQVATTTLLPLVGPSQSGQASSGQVTPTWTQPRQLPGSGLHLVPPADLYKINPVIVAGDPNGTPPDSPENRVDPNTPDSPFAGVGSLRIRVGSSSYICTATPISPIHVITAAHCMDTNSDGTIDTTPEGVTFNVNMGPSSSSTYQLTGNQLYVHPDWTGFNHPSINDDMAIVELASELPNDVPIYALNDVPFDDTVAAHFVGYGRSGNGVDGYTTGASFTVKRTGMNNIDSYFTDDEGTDARRCFNLTSMPPRPPIRWATISKPRWEAATREARRLSMMATAA